MGRLRDKPGVRIEHLKLKTHSFYSTIQEFDVIKAILKEIRFHKN